MNINRIGIWVLSHVVHPGVLANEERGEMGWDGPWQPQNLRTSKT